MTVQGPVRKALDEMFHVTQVVRCARALMVFSYQSPAMRAHTHAFCCVFPSRQLTVCNYSAQSTYEPGGGGHVALRTTPGVVLTRPLF